MNYPDTKNLKYESDLSREIQDELNYLQIKVFEIAKLERNGVITREERQMLLDKIRKQKDFILES